MTTPNMPEAAVEAVWSLFACRCLPAWTERKLHAPDCIQELGYDVMAIVAKACADERARVLAEVQAALRDDSGRIIAWWQDMFGLGEYIDPAAPVIAADYLRDTVGAGGEG